MNKNTLEEMSTTCLSLYRQFLFLKENKEILGRDKELLDETIDKLIDVSVFIGRLKYKIYSESVHEPFWVCYVCKQKIPFSSNIRHSCDFSGKRCGWCEEKIYHYETHKCPKFPMSVDELFEN